LFTHASIGTRDNQGIEFSVKQDDPRADQPELGEVTLQKSEISLLEALPWSKYGELWLHGCNTGIDREGWCPAQVFANSQKVTTFGQSGYAFFSEKKEIFDRAIPFLDTYPVFLRAYKRNKNVKDKEDSTNEAIPERACKPL